MIKYLKDNFRFLLLFWLGLTLILGFLYFRLLLNRLPKDLYFFVLENETYNYNYKLISIILYCILIAIVSLMINYKNIKNKPIKKHIIIIKIEQILSFIYEALLTVYLYLANKLNNGFVSLEPSVSWFYRKFNYRFAILIFSYLLPYVIVLICLLIDVFIFFRLNFFYKSLILLIIPLSINIWFFIIKDWTNNSETFESYLHITMKNNDTTFELKPEFKNRIKLMEIVDNYRKCLILQEFINNYNQFKNYYTTRFFIIYYTIYLYTWLYVCFSNYVLLT